MNMEMVKSLYKKVIKLIGSVTIIGEMNGKKSIDSITTEMAEDNATAFDWDRGGLWEPLDKSDEVGRYWHSALQGQEEVVKQNKRDLEDHVDDEFRTFNQELLDESIRDLKKLQEFYDNTTRCSERFKHDNKLMKQISDDWYDFNNSLYTDANREYLYHQYKPPHRSIGERKLRKLRLDTEKIRRDEIMRRMKMLLS